MSTGEDRRRFQRVQTFTFVSDEGRVHRTLDLSREGVQVEMKDPTPLGTRVDLSIALGELLIRVKGLVKRHVLRPDGHVGVGVEFDRLTPSADRAIRDFLLNKGKK
jgi:hypothetical protein